MLSPPVSVCIPTYNYARFLPEAIESILRQTFTDFELLIIDDGSTDDTAAVVQKFAAQDARIRFRINNPNLGMVNNWNLCLREARGEFIKFVFADDYLASPQALQEMLAPLLADSSISLVASARNLVDAESQVLQVRSCFGKSTILPGHQVIRRCLVAGRNLIGEPTVVLFRKQTAARGFNPAYRQIVDLEMWCHLLEQGRLAYLSEPLCAFRRHSEQQTQHNLRAHTTLYDTNLLLQDYLSKPGLNFSRLTRALIAYDFCYWVWSSCRKKRVAADYARATINQHFGLTRFRLCLPAYKIIRPCRKFVRHIARWLNYLRTR